jgi:hypothetical protein
LAAHDASMLRYRRLRAVETRLDRAKAGEG